MIKIIVQIFCEFVENQQFTQRLLSGEGSGLDGIGNNRGKANRTDGDCGGSASGCET